MAEHARLHPRSDSTTSNVIPFPARPGQVHIVQHTVVGTSAVEVVLSIPLPPDITPADLQLAVASSVEQSASMAAVAARGYLLGRLDAVADVAR